MKTKYTLLTGLALFAASAAFGQVEHDDMYFNSKDREKINASKQVVLAKQHKQEDIQAVKTSPINPTDSYSGRSVNPEYTNRLKTNPTLSNADSQYFVSGYQPVSVNQNLASNNCNCTSNSNYNNFNNPYYGGYGMNSYYGMNSGFGSPYSGFNSPWGMNGGMYQPGWSSMLGYGFGGMSSGLFASMSYGFGNSWGSPWNSGYGSPYNSYGYGMPYSSGYGSNYYGTPVVINNNIDSRNTIVYSKRANRSSDIDNLIDNSRPETGYTRTGREVATGRSRSESQSQYYDRGWKRDPEKNPSRSFWSDNSSSTNSGSRSQSSSNWNNNNTWGNSTSGGRQSSSDWGNGSSNSSRSSFSSSDSGSRSSSSGSMSSGSSSGGGSSGGSRSRGRD